MIRVPNEVWDNCKEKALVLGKSATATAVACIVDCLEQMGAPQPQVPKIVRVFHISKPEVTKKKK